MNTATCTEWKNDHKTSEGRVFKHCQKAQMTIININVWTDSSNKHWLTICIVTCFTATMRRLHAYYATKYNTGHKVFFGKSALHAYHKLNTCKFLATMVVHVCTIYNRLKTVLLVCNLFTDSKPFIPFCWKLVY